MQKNKKEIIEPLKTNKKNVGSSEVQIGALSEKINYLTPNNLNQQFEDVENKLNLSLDKNRDGIYVLIELISRNHKIERGRVYCLFLILYFIM